MEDAYGRGSACKFHASCGPTVPPANAGFGAPVAAPRPANVTWMAEGNVALDSRGNVLTSYMTSQNLQLTARCVQNGTSCTFMPATPTAMPSGGSGDPVVAVDPVTDAVHTTWIGRGVLTTSRSTDNGLTFTTPQDVGPLYDKPWISARNGVVSANDTGPGGLVIYRSIDGGMTFQAGVSVRGTGFSESDVDSAGNIYLTWWESNGPMAAVLPAGSTTIIGPVSVRSPTETRGVGSISVEGRWNPATGNFIVLYTLGPNPQPPINDMYTSRCTFAAGALTCTAGARINDVQGCGWRVWPALAVDEAPAPGTMGSVHVVWYEGRYGRGDELQVWYATSTDDGATWGPNQLAWSGGGGFNFGRTSSNAWTGDYMGVAARGGRAAISFVDTPDGFTGDRLYTKWFLMVK
jgi:hypothetical protein